MAAASAPSSAGATSALVLQPEDLNREWIVNARALHVDGHDTAAATLAASWAHEAGIPVIADLDELYPGVEDAHRQHRLPHRQPRFPLPPHGRRAISRAASAACSAAIGCRLTAATLGEDGVLAWDGHQLLHRRLPRSRRRHHRRRRHLPRRLHLRPASGLAPRRQLDFSCAAAAMNCMAAGARGGIQPVEAIENLVATAARYESAFNLPVLD